MIIFKIPNDFGAYSPPQTWNGAIPPEDYAAILKDLDLSSFYEHNGFVTLTIEPVEHIKQVEKIVQVEKTRQVEKERVVEKTREVEVTTPVEKTRTVEKTREVVETVINEETGEEETKTVEEVYYEEEIYYEDETHTETEIYYETEVYYEDETYFEDETQLVDEVYYIDTVVNYEPNLEAWTAWKAIPVEPEPPTAEERITSLEAENSFLKAQITAQSEQMDFYEDCIAEMAAVVYA